MRRPVDLRGQNAKKPGNPPETNNLFTTSEKRTVMFGAAQKGKEDCK
jgi:hypothetical protein